MEAEALAEIIGEVRRRTAGRCNVNPIETRFATAWLRRLAPKCDEQLLNVAFNFNLQRYPTDASASSRRLYENPGRTLVEGELRLLVQSIKRSTSGDGAEPSGRAGSFGGGGGGGGGSRLGWGVGGRSGSSEGARGSGETSPTPISWGDIGNGRAVVVDPRLTASGFNARS
jgi:hypothetical protein